jgi:hypothetical protein
VKGVLLVGRGWPGVIEDRSVAVLGEAGAFLTLTGRLQAVNATPAGYSI